MTKSSWSDESPVASKTVPWIGLILGGLASLLINWYNHHIRLTVGSQLSISHYPFLLFAALCFLAFIFRPVLAQTVARYRLSRSDLVAALVIGFIGTAIPPLVIRFVATVTAPYYFATPENQWAEYAFPYLPTWLFPTNDAGQMGRFYQGLLPGETIPWEAWVFPMVWWISLLLAMLFGCVFTAVIFRKQWVDRERLAFPHVQVSLALVEGPPESFLPRCTRSPLFRIGFLISALPLLWNFISYFSPGFPVFGFIQGYPQLEIARGFPVVFTKFDFYVIGFAYFTPLEILFSIWFFHVLTVVQVGISQRVGFGPSTPDSGTNWQTAGGMVAFVLWGLWISRGHLRGVWDNAWRGGLGGDDSGELVSYRVAVFGGLACLVFVIGWLWSAGMTMGVILPFVALYFVLSFGVAKIVSMAGLISLRWPWQPNAMIIGTFGSRGLGMANFAVLSITEALHCIWKGFALSASGNAVRLGDEIDGDRRSVGKAVLVVGALSVIAGVASLVIIGYEQGAENFQNFVFRRSNRFTYEMISAVMMNPEKVKAEELGFFSTGLLITGVLTALMYRFTWWPLHPLGSTIAFSWPIRASAFSIFIAWAVKAIVLRVGGIALYRKSQDLFVGLLAGYAFGIVASLVIDFIWFPGQGHTIHSAPM